jgi:hypothetical protein
MPNQSKRNFGIFFVLMQTEFVTKRNSYEHQEEPQQQLAILLRQSLSINIRAALLFFSRARGT